MAFEYLAEYATFKTVADMDSNVKKHIDKYRLDLTANERAIVFAIAGRSLMYPGASHLKAETVCKAVGISRSTFMRSIKKLVAVGIIEKLNQTKLNGIMGANVYKILPFTDTASVTQRNEAIEASYDEVSEPISEEGSIKSFNLLSSKQAKNIYNLSEELALQAAKEKEYMNEYQQLLYDFMSSLSLTDGFKDELHKLVLASEIDSVQAFHKAKNVLVSIANDIADGTLTISKTFRSAFVGAYNKACERLSVSTKLVSTVEEEPRTSNPVKFYDWLSEREGPPQISSSGHYSNLENWLLW